MKHKQNESDALFLKAGEGRVYSCGAITEWEIAERYILMQ